MPKNDFESTNFANFEEVVNDFGRSDDDMICVKMFIFNICRRGLMPNMIKKSWTLSILYRFSLFIDLNLALNVLWKGFHSLCEFVDKTAQKK